ncbi:tyrosine-protein phosphatase [Levilactobacillus brevis]|uniref:tyrosine-protein phosphatase n=1 Tax=Levilactobacillus brevis TaxID=1580 RepID=UPI0022DD8EF8|nr:tyrosine-protein phosphatase [Levilactobacillus brevis]MDA0409888.1 tyrosine-protein phosphatase [Levilactobacillus brevis]
MRFQTVLTTLGCATIMATAVTPAYAATAKDSQLQPAISQKVNWPIHLEGAENMRDLGGYRTKSGQRVKMGKVLRSASLEKLTAADVINLQVNHQLTEIVDLRTTEQIMKKPDPVMEGVKYLQASVLGTRSNYDDDDQGMYNDMAHKAAAKRSYRNLLIQIAENKRGALLFHCSHGMDRTGTAAAILYSILGVSKQDIQRDYLLSNTQLGVTWAKPALLNSFYKQINQQYGSMDKYVKHGLKLSSAQIKAIKTNLLTKASH